MAGSQRNELPFRNEGKQIQPKLNLGTVGTHTELSTSIYTTECELTSLQGNCFHQKVVPLWL